MNDSSLYLRGRGAITCAVEDNALQDYLIENNIALEQCITSNYQTGSWADEKNHPMGTLYRKGVPVTLNSDDYLKAVSYFNFNLQDIINLNLTALNAAFLPEDEKNRLKDDYLKRLDEFRKRFAL